MNSIDGNLQAILASSTYRLAEMDPELLQSEQLRHVRVQLEMLKVELALRDAHIQSTVVVFGGTQIVEESVADARLQSAKQRHEAHPENPEFQRQVQRAERVLAKSHFYGEAREFGRIVSQQAAAGEFEHVVVTGGGPGIMEAANRGAYDVGAPTIGLNITLPHEQEPNPYITPELCFMFRYFALRKLHFLLRARALVVFPGGFGTLDELFDALTLRQTSRMQEIPIVLVGKAYWDRVIDFQFLADEGVIADHHLNLINYAESATQAWKIIQDFERSLA